MIRYYIKETSTYYIDDDDISSLNTLLRTDWVAWLKAKHPFFPQALSNLKIYGRGPKISKPTVMLGETSCLGVYFLLSLLNQ